MILTSLSIVMIIVFQNASFCSTPFFHILCACFDYKVQNIIHFTSLFFGFGHDLGNTQPSLHPR